MGIKTGGRDVMETKPTTISKVIAFELGLLIAVLTWIAFAGVPGMKPRPVTEVEEPADTSFANVSPVYQAPQPRRRAPVNYPADDLRVAQAPAQYPAATVQTYDPGLTTGGYDDTVGGNGQPSYGYDQPNVEGYVFNPNPADSIGIFPEPVLDPYYYYPSYSQPYGYAAPLQIVILNNNRSFAPRNRMPRCNLPGGTVNAPRRNPPAPPPVQGDRAVVTRPGPVAMGPSAGPRPRVNPVNNNSTPRRSAPARNTRPGQASQVRWNP
jgi:hypothetical protein